MEDALVANGNVTAGVDSCEGSVVEPAVRGGTPSSAWWLPLNTTAHFDPFVSSSVPAYFRVASSLVCGSMTSGIDRG